MCALDILTEAIAALSLPATTRVVVATSGGPDSVALALSFHALSREPGCAFDLRLAHIHHELRGTEADGDEEFVRILAHRLKLEVEVARVDTRQYAAQTRQSIETAARELRYRELRRILRSWEGDVIAVGHHLDDQAETILMHLLRGAGLDGLTGMQVRSNDIVRPFLRLPKDAIVAALTTAGETYRTDASNDDTRARRNYVRHRVLPVLDEVRPGSNGAIAATGSRLRIDAEYFHAETVRALQALDTVVNHGRVSASRGAFRMLHQAVQERVVRQLIRAMGVSQQDLSESHVVLMRERIGAKVETNRLLDQLPHNLNLELTRDRFHLFYDTPVTAMVLEPAILPIPGRVETEVGRLEATIIETDSPGSLSRELAVCGPRHAFCDAQLLPNALHVRSRRPGDRLRRLHASGSRKLHDLFIDAKIPRWERDRIPVVENSSYIVWVPGFGPDHRVSISPETRRVAHLQYRPFV